MKGMGCNTCDLDKTEIVNYKGDRFINTGCSLTGAWRCLQALKNDTAIIVHGAIGCNNEFKLDYKPGLAATYNTNLNEIDIINGGEEKLRATIKFVDSHYKPKLIAVLGTCASELIGDDVDGIIDDLSKQIKSKIFVLHTSGMSGKMQTEGQNMVNKYFAEHIMKKQKIIPKSINYLGYSFAWDYSEGRDLNELKKMLGKTGIKLLNTITTGCSVNDIERAPAAALNVIRCPPSTYDCVKIMKEKFDTPYIYPPMPIGIKNTTEFLLEITNFFEVKKAQEIIYKEERKALEKIEKIKKHLKGKKAAVCIGASKTPYLIGALADFGLDVKLISYYRSWETVGDKLTEISGKTMCVLKKICKEKNIESEILVYPDQRQYKNALRQSKFDVVFDANYNHKLIYNLGYFFMESMDNPQPFLGYNGAVILAYDLAKEFTRDFYKKYQKYQIK